MKELAKRKVGLSEFIKNLENMKKNHELTMHTG